MSDIKENFYQKLNMLREYTGGLAPSMAGRPKPGVRDIPGSGVTTQKSGAKVTTPSAIKPTEYSGDTGTREKVMGAIKSVTRAGNEAIFGSRLGLKSHESVPSADPDAAVRNIPKAPDFSRKK